MAGWAIGPIVGSRFDPETFRPFLCGVVAVVLAALLLVPARGTEAGFGEDERRGAGLDKLGLVFLAAPTALLSSAMFGVLEGGMQSFAHLYTMDILGQGFRQTGYAVIWVGSIGAIFFQNPAGWLADKLDRVWLFGVGGMVGPMIAGMSMTEMGPEGFIRSMLATVLAYGVFAACREAAGSPAGRESEA